MRRTGTRPGVADILTQKAAEVALKQEEMGLPACLLVPDQIRGAISASCPRGAPVAGPGPQRNS